MKRAEPALGQESVWDYPRPPRVELVSDRVRVEFAGTVVADSSRALRVLETSHPPVYYVPQEDILPGVLEESPTVTFCEFKGYAAYWSLQVGGRRSLDAGWSYPSPAPGFELLDGMVAFYPSRVDACYVADEAVEPQAGDFYGGWITGNIVGPFKGGPGTRSW